VILSPFPFISPFELAATVPEEDPTPKPATAAGGSARYERKFRSSERGFLYQQQQQQQMRLDSHHQNKHSLPTLSLSKEGNSEDKTTPLAPTDESHNQQNQRHHIASSYQNTTLNETCSAEHDRSQNNQHQSHIDSNVTSQYTGVASENSIPNRYNADECSQNLEEHLLHPEVKRDHPNSKGGTSTDMYSDDEDDDDNEEERSNAEINNAKINSPYLQTSSESILPNRQNHVSPAYNYSAAGANELLNRYCLEQTIRHLHEFQDARNLSTNASNNAISNPATSLQSHLQSHQTS
jgi:hypothetical protein